MTPHERELLCSRIVSGRTLLTINREGRSPSRFVVVDPTDQFTRWKATEVWVAAYEAAQKDGLVTLEQSLDMVRESGLWDKAEDTEYEQIAKTIDTFKLKYFKAFGTSVGDRLKREIEGAIARQNHLTNLRHSLYHITADAIASAKRTRYLVGTGLRRYSNDEPVWAGSSFWNSRSSLLDDCVAAWLGSHPSQAAIRELARNEPWRSIWASREAGAGVWDTPASALTELQKSLVAWSRIYDSAREDSERPSEAILSDDWAFDGWLTSRREAAQRDDSNRAAAIARTSNPKILNSEMVFIAKDDEDQRTDQEFAAEVNSLNSEAGKAIIAARMAAIDRAAAEGLSLDEMAAPERRIQRRLDAGKVGGS